MITTQGMLNLRDEWTRYCVYEDNELVGTQGEDVLRNFRRAERQGYMGRFSHHDDGVESSIFWFKYAEDKHPLPFEILSCDEYVVGINTYRDHVVETDKIACWLMDCLFDGPEDVRFERNGKMLSVSQWLQ